MLILTKDSQGPSHVHCISIPASVPLCLLQLPEPEPHCVDPEVGCSKAQPSEVQAGDTSPYGVT